MAEATNHSQDPLIPQFVLGSATNRSFAFSAIRRIAPSRRLTDEDPLMLNPRPLGPTGLKTKSQTVFATLAIVCEPVQNSVCRAINGTPSSFPVTLPRGTNRPVCLDSGGGSIVMSREVPVYRLPRNTDPQSKTAHQTLSTSA